MNRKYSLQSRRGFTIIELIIVMLILIILAVVAGLLFSGLSDRAKAAADNANLKILNTATAHYAADKNAVNGDIFYGAATDAARMQVLIDSHFLSGPVTTQQKNFEFTWDVIRQSWLLKNLSPSSSQSASSQSFISSSASSISPSSSAISSDSSSLSNASSSSLSTSSSSSSSSPSSSSLSSSSSSSSSPSSSASSSTPVVPVQKVTLNYSNITLTSSSRTKTLIATITPSNATNKSVTWTSSNTAVATVDSSGVVRYVKAGTANITVKTVDGNKTATCKVTVK